MKKEKKKGVCFRGLYHMVSRDASTCWCGVTYSLTNPTQLPPNFKTRLVREAQVAAGVTVLPFDLMAAGREEVSSKRGKMLLLSCPRLTLARPQ
ncbi:hypothetical protein RJT34_19953 [Clitoria ternatea]|uniref:Uncharacterized protein n=1 Tax=Clitoria ternatea TaxID=43366 RepID=A0AAN9IS01_CLITE